MVLDDVGSGRDIYCFEKSLTKTGGKAGFADVWKKDCFAWEYKGKGKYNNLDAAYSQLLLYKEDLGNPPVLVVCDIARIDPDDVADTFPDVPILGYTNHTDTSGLRAAHAAGFDQVVAKSALVERARELVEELTPSG